MTRISSYDLYKCKSCRQIHVKPRYGSVSTYRPKDLHIEPTDLKKCKGCGIVNEFQIYQYVKSCKKIDTKPPSMLKLLILHFKKTPYVELDVRRLYPTFD